VRYAALFLHSPTFRVTGQTDSSTRTVLALKSRSFILKANSSPPRRPLAAARRKIIEARCFEESSKLSFSISETINRVSSHEYDIASLLFSSICNLSRAGIARPFNEKGETVFGRQDRTRCMVCKTFLM